MNQEGYISIQSFVLRITHDESSWGVEDQLLDASLFTVSIDWYGLVKEYLKKWYFENDVPKEERKCITIKAWPYTLQNNILYKLRPDVSYNNVWINQS